MYKKSKYKRRSVAWRITQVVILLSILSAVFITGIGYFFYRNSTINAYASLAGNIATSFATTIDDRLIASINVGHRNQYHHTLERQMNSILTELPEVFAFYIIVPYDGAFWFFTYAVRPDSDPEAAREFREIERHMFGAEAHDALTRGVFTTTTIYSVGNYNLISGFAPVITEAGEVIALVGVDFNVSHVVAASNLYLVYIGGFGLFFSLIFGFIIRWRISRTLSYTLKRIVEADHTFSSGATFFKSRDEDADTKDEIGVLYHYFAEMINTFSVLLTDVKTMANSHISGDYEIRLDESKFKGGHQQLVRSVNMMTDMYVKNFEEIVNTVKSYGEGDFEANVSTYPQKWQWANHAINDLRESFIHVTTEIEKLTKNATNGSFDVPADIGKQRGEWAKLIEGLNALLRAVEEPLARIEHQVVDMSKGEFSPLSGDFKGRFSVVKDACNDTNRITQSLVNEIAYVLNAIAKGDLTAELRNSYIGSYSPIEQALRTILSSLNNSMNSIAVAANEVLTGSEKLSTNAEELAIGTSSQSDTIDSLYAAIATIADKTKYNTERAQDADVLSQKSNEHAKNGNKEMESMLLSMQAIKASNVNISKVIKVIEDIAFQTNLLALNAAVEAARAGIHGAGFAVVAEEVRNLAARSQTAARETTGLITDSTAKVDQGTGAVQSTAASLNLIVNGVDTVSELISQIAQISQEQADGISNVVTGINAISDVVKRNVSASEDCAAVAGKFNNQAKILTQLVDFYKLKQ